MVIPKIKIHVPMGACPPNPRVVTTSRVAMIAVDTGPLPDSQGSLPCFVRLNRRCR